MPTLQSLLDQGKTIRSVTGTPEEVFDQLIGKTICHGSQFRNGRLEYLVHVSFVKDKPFQCVLKGLYFSSIEGKATPWDWVCGRLVSNTYWVVE